MGHVVVGSKYVFFEITLSATMTVDCSCRKKTTMHNSDHTRWLFSVGHNPTGRRRPGTTNKITGGTLPYLQNRNNVAR